MTDPQRRLRIQNVHDHLTRILDLLALSARSQALALEMVQKALGEGHGPSAPPKPRPSETHARVLRPAEIGPQVLRAIQALVADARLHVNEPHGHLYVQGDYVAVVVPDTLRRIRQFLKHQGVRLPDDSAVYDTLRDGRWAVADAHARIVKRLRVQAGPWAGEVKAILLQGSRLDGMMAYAGFSEVSFEEIAHPMSVPTRNSSPLEGSISSSVVTNLSSDGVATTGAPDAPAMQK